MPIAQTQQEKYIAGIKVDKESATTFFNEETHTYYDKETLQKGISVTTLINKYCNEFDADFWSAVKTMEKLLNHEDWLGLKPLLLNTKQWKEQYLNIYGVKKELFDLTRQEILNEWDRKKKESCEKGTAKHLEKELSFYNRKTYDFTKYGAPEYKGHYNCYQDNYDLSLGRGIYPEFLISLHIKDLFLNGQIDCLILDNNEATIIDWKTNAEIKKTSYYDPKKKKYQMMKFPLNNLQDTVWNHYQLQLGTYAFMLEQLIPGITIKHLNLIHLKEDGSEEVMPCEYLKEDVERMIKHYYKQVKVQNQLDRCKQIKY